MDIIEVHLKQTKFGRVVVPKQIAIKVPQGTDAECFAEEATKYGFWVNKSSFLTNKLSNDNYYATRILVMPSNISFINVTEQVPF